MADVPRRIPLVRRDVYEPEDGTEYGGTPGLIQPDPHELTAHEKLMQIYHTLPEAAWVNGTDPVEEQEIPVTESLG